MSIASYYIKHNLLRIFALGAITLLAYTVVANASNIEGTITYPDHLFILVHGISDDHSLWDGSNPKDRDRNLKAYLENDLGLKGYVYAYSFSSKNGSVLRQAQELGDRGYYNPAKGMGGKCWLEKAKEDFHSRYPDRPVPTKFVLITHSMGNYAARLYIYSKYIADCLDNCPFEPFYQNDITKVVYIAPPFNGSDVVFGAMLKEIALKSMLEGEFHFWVDMLNHMHGYSFLYDPWFSYRVCKKYGFYRIQGEKIWEMLQKYAAGDLSGGRPGFFDEAVWDLMPSSKITQTLKGAQFDDDTIEPSCSVVYGKGIPVFNLNDTALLFGVGGFGLKPLISDKLAARLKDYDYQNLNNDLGSFSDYYSADELFTIQKKISEIYQNMGTELNLMLFSDWSKLSTNQAKYLSLLMSQGVAFTYDGDSAVPVHSAKGPGVRAVRGASFYSKTFETTRFSNFLGRELPLETALAIASYYTMVAFGVPSDAAIQIQWVPVICYIDAINQDADNLREDFAAHSNLVKEYDMITTALLDTPGVFTLYSLQCPISVETEAVSEETRPMSFSVSGVVRANYEVIKVRSAAENRIVANNPIQPVPSTLDEDRKYLTQVLVTKIPKRVTGKLNYLIPAKMRQFEYSFNFQAWQPITDVNPESGEFAIDDLHFAEGQNLLAIRSINAVGVSNHQLMKIIVNTIPMQASKYLPESNYMTNNVYQPIGVEFNKSTYYEDVAGMINILSFEVDNINCLVYANITSEIDGAYHPYARVNYTPTDPFSDGEHSITVKAKSDVGVSQAIWSFFVDTQCPTVSIETLAPYSPRAPIAQPLSIRYKTADNLSTFLRNGTIKVYDSNNDFVTTIATFDSQAAGESYCSIDPASLESVSDGTYSIQIKAYDAAGNSTTESISLIIDSTPPSILEADVSPKPMTSRSDAMNFSTDISENSIVTIKMINKATGVASAYIAQAQGAGDEGKATAFYSWSYNNQFGISGPEDGLYKIEVAAQDAAGNVSAPYIVDNVRIDRTPPVIYANACLPYVLANAGANPYTTTLSYQISESNDKTENKSGTSGQGLGASEGSGNQGISVNIKLFNENSGEMVKMWSSAAANISTLNSITWNGNSSYVPKGAYKFQITATDAFGNSSTAYSTCVKDGIAPIISFPAKDQTVSGTIAIRGTAVDPDWTNNRPFKDYRVYYARGNIPAPANVDALGSGWLTEFIEVPTVNRDARSETGDAKNISIRPLQNDSTLAYLYTNGLENGTYTLLLIAEEDNGQSMACSRIVEVRNDPMFISTDIPVVKLNPLPQKVHFTADGNVKLPISFVNGIKKSNVNIEVVRSRDSLSRPGGIQSQAPSVVFYKFQPGVVGNQYTGKPNYQPGQNLGYYIWNDETGWHIRWSSDGQNHRFTGSLMGSGITNIQTINWSRDVQSQAPMVSWDKTMSNGEAGIDFTADSNAMLIITPKIDEDPNVPSFSADNIYFGMTKATQSYLPVMISASMEGVAPEVAEWDGKLDTGGFADSGVYTVRVRSEGADGVGLATDEAQVEVETDFDISNVEAVNKEFSPVSAPDRVSIYYNLSKDSYITAYVYKDNGLDILDVWNTPPVATITSEAFVPGNMNPNHKHVLTWRGNYPYPDSSRFFCGDSYNVKIVASAADGSSVKEAKVDGIKISHMDFDGEVAMLEPIGEQVPFNGQPSWIAEGSSDYYFEAKGDGRLYPPKQFNLSLTPYGRQYVTTYPYVPFAMLIHRGYKQVNVDMRARLIGVLREEYKDGGDWKIDHSDYDSFVGEKQWGFRDEPDSNHPNTTGPSFNFNSMVRSYSIDPGRDNDSKMWFRETILELVFFTQTGPGGSMTNARIPSDWDVATNNLGKNYVLDRLRVPMMDDHTVIIPKEVATQDAASQNAYVIDKLRTLISGKPTVFPSEKGIFKVVADLSDYAISIRDPNIIEQKSYKGCRIADITAPIGCSRTKFRCNVKAMLEAPVKYSRLTNRFVPFFGFANKNHTAISSGDAPAYNIEKLGFPGDEFFNKSSARPYDEFDEMLADSAKRQNMSKDQLIRMLRSLEGQKNYAGYIETPKCTLGWEYYLSDPVTEEYGIEFIPITEPEKGAFLVTDFTHTSSMGSYTIYATTEYTMAYNTNPQSLFYFSFPATDSEISNFQATHAAILDRFRRSPTLWTGVGVNSPHELDVNSVVRTSEVETKLILGQEIKYGPGGYSYFSAPLNELYWGESSAQIPPNACNVKYNWRDISDQSITLSLDSTNEASGGARLKGSSLGGDIRWTTADDPVLVPYGGVIRSGRLRFNKDGFSGTCGPLTVSLPYTSGECLTCQNMGSPNMMKYTFWKYNVLKSTIEANDTVDNQYLVYDAWQITLRDPSGNEDCDLVPLDVKKGNTRLEDNFQVKLRLDSAEKKFVEIRGLAAGEYQLMYFDGNSWKLIKYSPSGKEGTLGWWNVSRLNGKYTVLLKVGGVISSKDVLIGSVVRPQNVQQVTSPYKRAEVIFKAGVFDKDQLVTVTPVRADEIDVKNRPLIPTVGPIVEVKPSPYYFQTGSQNPEDLSSEASAKEDMRPTLIFRYTKDDLQEMYPKINVNNTLEVAGLGLNIHQITEQGDLQIISDNRQSYDGGTYAFEGPLDHFSEYALIRGAYNLKAPVVLTDSYIVNATPITVYGTAQAESVLNIYVSSSKEGNIASLESIATLSLGSDESGIAAYKFEKVPLIVEGDNYIFVTSTKGSASTRSRIIVRYDITAPTTEASSNLPAFSPNGDGKFDSVDYTIKSNENGKLYFVMKDAKGETVLNKEIDCKADEENKIEWDGKDQNSNSCPDGDYTYVAFAVDEAGNISNNVTGHTIIDRAPPTVTKISVNPYSFTPNDDSINDTTTISFEVSEPCYATTNIYRNGELFFDHGTTVGSRDVQSQALKSSWQWDGKGSRNELIGGQYTFNIVAEDSVGNVSTSEFSSVHVDRAAFLVDYAYADPMYFSPVNPKNDRTKIVYSLSRDDLKVDIQVLDGLGNVVALPVINETKKGGVNEAVWDGKNISGNKVQNGTYGFKVRAVDPVDGASGEVTGNVIVDNDPPTISINKLDILDESANVIYSIPEESKISIAIVDGNGQVVAELATGESLGAGQHSAEFDFGGSHPELSEGSVFAFRIHAEDKALNSDEKTSSSFTLPGPLEIYDAGASPAIFNPNSSVINKYTTVRYRLKAKAAEAQVTVKALSNAGATTKMLADGERQANGTYSLVWYGDDITNAGVVAGNYNIEISAVDDLGNTAKRTIPVIVAANSAAVLSVSPEVFSPNSDGIADSTLFTYTVDYYWQLTGEAQIYLEVYDSNSDLVHTYSNHHTQGTYSYLWETALPTYETYSARIRLVDPAGTTVYSNLVALRADLGAGSSLPETGFVSCWDFTPNCDGQGDSASFSYSIDEQSYVTIKMHKYNGAGPYDSSNYVWTVMDNILTDSGTWSATWYGSSEGIGDSDGNGYADKGRYAFILETVDQYGNRSPKQGATVWVKDVPVIFSGDLETGNPSPKVFTAIGGNTMFAYQLLQLGASGESGPPEKLELSGMKVKDAAPFNIGRVTVKVYDSAGALVLTALDRQVADNMGVKYATCEGAGLSEGRYTIVASAEDLTGVPALNSIGGTAFVDSTPPVISGVSIDTDRFSPGINSVTANYMVTDNLSSITTDVSNEVRVRLEVYKGGNPVKTVTDSPTIDSGSSSFSVWDGSLNEPGQYAGTRKAGGIYSDGSYTIKVIAVDAAGNTSEVVQSVTVDTMEPSFESISISQSPFSPNGDGVKDSASISFSIDEASNVTVEVFRGSERVYSRGAWVTASDSCAWNGLNTYGTYEGDGSYVCRIIACDSAGNTNEVTRTIITDTVPPSISLTASPDVVSGNQRQISTIEAAVSDSNNGINWSVSVGNDCLLGSTESDSGNDFLYWAPSYEAANDGDYVCYFVATDEAGNTAVTTEIISLDNTSPTAEITLPTPNSWQRGAISITGNIFDAHPGHYLLCFDGPTTGEVMQGDGNKSNAELGTWGTTGLNGEYTVRLYASDEVGNMGYTSATYYIDNTAPVISGITSEVQIPDNPAERRAWFNPYLYDGAVINVTFEVNDNMSGKSEMSYPTSEVVLGSVQICRPTVLANGTSETWILEWGGNNDEFYYVNEGTYEVRIYATDLAGNTRMQNLDIEVRDDEPVTDSYSHHPSLTLNGTLNLKYISGECWGITVLEVTAHEYTGTYGWKTGIEGRLDSFVIEVSQPITAQYFHEKQSTVSYSIINSIGEPIVHDQRDAEDGTFSLPEYSFPPGRYLATAICDTSGGNRMAHLYVPYLRSYRNVARNWDDQNDEWGDSYTINEGVPAELCAIGGNIEHVVWASTWSGRKYYLDTDNYFEHFGDNNHEIMFNKKINGALREAIDPESKEGHDNDYEAHPPQHYHYPVETRLSNADGNSINPAVACDSTGNKVFVVWEDWRYGRGEIYLRRSADAGDVWADEEVFVSDPGVNYTMPSIAMDPAGNNIYVAFLKNNNGHQELNIKKSTNGGTSWQGPVRITRNEFLGCEVVRSSIVASSDGDAYVAWEDTRTGTSEIFFQKIPSNFAPFTGSSMTTMSIGKQSQNLRLTSGIFSPTGNATPEVISPKNGVTVKSLRPTFRWYGIQDWNDYRIQCATTSDEASLSSSLDYFDPILAEVAGMKPEYQFTVSEYSTGLDESTQTNPYWYWRVMTINTIEAVTSEVASFRIELPLELSSVTNWPNPFDPDRQKTKIRYRLGSQADSVTIRIYDITGALVRELEGTCNAEGASIWSKYNDVEWDGTNGRGDVVLNGVYPFEITVSYGNRSIKGRGKIVVLK